MAILEALHGSAITPVAAAPLLASKVPAVGKTLPNGMDLLMVAPGRSHLRRWLDGPRGQRQRASPESNAPTGWWAAQRERFLCGHPL